MSDIPIIFSAPMIRALLDGRKTMTRRLAWTPWKKNLDAKASYKGHILGANSRRPSLWHRVKPGDRLWVRENLAVMGNWGLWHDASDVPIGGQFLDDLDGRGHALLENYAPADATTSALIPSIYMPRWASRLTLVVTATKIERLMAIGDEDAQREGVVEDNGSEPNIWYVPGAAEVGWKIQMAANPAMVFRSLWENLHGIEAWNENPNVVALAFSVHKQNIDAMPKTEAA